MFSITNDCNLDCPKCFTFNRPDQRYFKSLEETRQIIRNCIDQVNRQIDRRVDRLPRGLQLINLTGGEPTLHPRLFDILALCREENIQRVTMNTNGLRLAEDEGFAKKLKESGVQLVLSLDTLEPETSRIIHGEDITTQKLKALETIEKLDIPATILHVCIKDVNHNETAGIVQRYIKKGFVKSITIQNMTYTGKNGSRFEPREHITMDEVENLLCQKDGFSPGDFFPLGSYHPLCYSVAYYIVAGGTLFPLVRLLGEETLRGLSLDSYLLEPTGNFAREFSDGINLEKSCPAHGFSRVSVSTNGLRLLEEKKNRDVFKRTQAIAALQFDGFSPAAVSFLRGKDITSQKRELIDILEAEGIYYSLVATVAKGINFDQIAEIVDFFFKSKALTLMFQPLAFSGNAARLDAEQYRLTVPCVVRELERSAYVSVGDFNPLPCSHFSCFALSYYLQVEGGRFVSLKSFLGEEHFLCACANKTLPGLDGEGYGIIRDKLYELWSAADSGSLDEKVLARVKNILRTMQGGNLSNRQKIMLGAEHMKAVFIHHFMDLHTMDFGRLVKCCNPYPRVGNRLVPMCAENVCFSPRQRRG